MLGLCTECCKWCGGQPELNQWRGVCAVGGAVLSCPETQDPQGPSSLSVEIHDIILKCTWKFKGPERAKVVVRRSASALREVALNA